MRRGAARAAAPLAALAAVAIGISACRPAPSARWESRVEATEPAGRHAVHGEELREHMQQLEALRHSLLPQEMDLYAERQRHRREVARVASALARAAEELPEPLAAAEGGEREAVLRRAARLRDLSRALAEDASALPLPALRERVAEIEATCEGCHARFRAPRDADSSKDAER